MKRVRRWMPYEVSQYHETEQWLERKAAQGLHFIDCRLGLATFARGEGKAVRYRLEFAHGSFAPEPEQRELYREMGWEYVDSIRNDYFVFRAEDPEAAELHTEEALLAEDVKRLCDRQLSSGLILAVPAIEVYRLLYSMLWRGPIWGAAFYGTWGPLLLTLSLVFFAAQLLRDVTLAWRCKRGARTRTLLPLRPCWLFLLCAFLGMFLLTVGQHNWSGSTTPTEDLAVPVLAEIDPDAYGELTELRAIQSDPERLGAYWKSGRDFSCADSYKPKWDPLVSRAFLEQSYRLYPNYEGPGPHTLEIERATDYRVYSYDCLTAGMAGELAELLRTMDGELSWETVEEGAVWTARDEYQLLLLRSGRRVWQVTYLGEKDLLSFLPAFRAAI